MEDYKQEIIETRKGSLGGSDAAMLKQIAELGYVPKSAMKRLAVAKGFIEQPQVTNAAMRFGDFIEMSIFDSLSQKGLDYESNVCLVSTKLSKKNITLLCHPDFMLVDYEKRLINVYECKCSKFSVQATKETYRPQMFVEQTLAKEYAQELWKKDPTKSRFKVNMFLVHYNALGVDLDEAFEFDPSRMTITRVFRESNPNCFDIDAAMTIVNDFMETFDSYFEDEEIDAEYLPEKVKMEFDNISVLLTEIKEREAKVDEFKAKLYEFMKEKDIKSVKGLDWSVTRIDPSESVSFDYKAFLDDYANKHPKLYRKLVKTFEKRTKKKGSVQIRVKKQ